MYLDDLADAIRAALPADKLPAGDVKALLRSYAVLARAKGAGVTQSDVHDAWAAWIAGTNPNHESLQPYEDLPPEVQGDDRVFAQAIRRVANRSRGPLGRPSFREVLFPDGPPESEIGKTQAFELYKIMVASSEALVGRRQGVNTFFLTMNGALLTAAGIIVQSSGNVRLGGLGVAVLGVAGAILCQAWASLVISFGQLNRGKFRVINTIEQYFSAAVYAAEWEALGRGEDRNIYRSFTSREIWVPNAFFVLHLITAVAGFLIALEYLNLSLRT